MSDPTPHQRAEYIVRKLEQFIRDGKNERGMSFKTWQSLARAELINAFAEQDKRLLRKSGDLFTKRIVLTAAAALVTIGFWGVVMSVDTHFGGLAALIIFGSGIILAAIGFELGVRRIILAMREESRKRGLDRIANYDDLIKQLEDEMWRKLKKTREKAEEMAKADRG